MRARLIGCLLAVASVAAAQAPSPAAQAKAAYEQGVARFKAKQFREAVVSFNKAYRLDPSPILLYNIARAFEELREYGSAIEFYKQYLASGKANDRAAVQQTIRTLELVQQEQQKPMEQTRYTLDSTPSGAEVLLGGKPVGATPLTLTIARGTYTIELRKAGFAPRRLERALAIAEQSETVALEAEAPAAPVAEARDAPEAPPSSRATWGWTAVGVGGALVAGAVFTGLKAQAQADKLDEIDADPGAFTDRDFDDAQSSGRAWGLTTDVLWGLGAASIGTGLWLLLTDDAPTTAGWVPFGAGAAYQGQF